MKEHISLLPSSRPPTHPSPPLFRTESNRFRRDSIRPAAKKKASITSFYPDLLYISPPRAPTPLDGNREARAPIYIKHLAPFKKTKVEGTGNASFSLSLYGKYFISRTGQRSGGGQKKGGVGLDWCWHNALQSLNRQKGGRKGRVWCVCSSVVNSPSESHRTIRRTAVVKSVSINPYE